ncbi:MAG TPA: helix-turn-helix domain-containing protein [Candidatus Limnocylindrales bacterium]
MSEFDAPDGRRRRRADAQRNVSTILDAAVALLGRAPEASMDDIAVEAGVTRQTVYAHFRSRQAILDAVVERVTTEVVSVLDSINVDEGSAATALRRWLDAAWALMERYPVLLSPAMPVPPPQEEVERHEPVIGPLLALIRRGQRAGDFDRRFPADWLVAATIALGHAAGQEVAAGRMTSRKAGKAFAESVLRLYGAPNS